MGNPGPFRPGTKSSTPGENPGPAFLSALASEYFSLLAEQFPTLCLHDEFMFFPRLTLAWEHRFRVARLEASALIEAACRVKDFLSRLDQASPRPDPEDAADAAMLRQSLKSVLRELSPGGPWEFDPFLYLKTASLAWAPLLTLSTEADPWPREELAELLAQTALLFTWGRTQVRQLSPPVPLLAAGAFADAAGFFRQVVPDFLRTRFADGTFTALFQDVSRSLQRFQEQVAALPPAKDFARGEAGLSAILEESWGWSGGLQKAREFLEEEIEASREALAHWAAQMRPGLSWPEALENLTPPAPAPDLLSLYRLEVARLQDFWRRSPALPPPRGQVVVAETPGFLQTLRSSASYAAPWGPLESPGYFYITPVLADLRHHWQHHRFLSAHETVPGHHFLDAIRLNLASPLRRAYESPLYYEGWSCYAETLLLTEGYLRDPGDHLVGWQRRYWRALRGLADLELQRGAWSLEQGRHCLGQAGYPEAAVRRRILHLALNPGYQLCYILGLKEILRLRKRFAPRLGLARFHEILLSGGQLPFHLVENRLQAAVE
jgi:hypothetical protein